MSIELGQNADIIRTRSALDKYVNKVTHPLSTTPIAVLKWTGRVLDNELKLHRLLCGIKQ